MPATTIPLGTRIANARNAMDMTQLALAHAIGWKGADAGAQISRIESGKIEPRISTVRSIAYVLDVTIDSLIGQ